MGADGGYCRKVQKYFLGVVFVQIQLHPVLDNVDNRVHIFNPGEVGLHLFQHNVCNGDVSGRSGYTAVRDGYVILHIGSARPVFPPVSEGVSLLTTRKEPVCTRLPLPLLVGTPTQW